MQTGLPFRSILATTAVFGIGFFCRLSGQSINVAWVRQVGTSATEEGDGVAVDLNGNAFLAGHSHASLASPNAGGADAILSKFDGNGAPLWARQLGSGSHDFAEAVAVDVAGNPFILGSTHGSIGASNAGLSDIFLTKYQSNGNLAWSKQLGSSASDSGRDVALDLNGNAYICGMTNGSLAGVYAGGSRDVVVAKYGAGGSLAWSTQFGTSGEDVSLGVAVDVSGNTLVSGYTDGSLSAPSAGRTDVFLRKLDAGGATVWSKQIGTSGDEASEAVAVDALGSAFVVGSTTGSLGGTSSGAADAFLSKFDANGNLAWSRQLGSAGNDFGMGVAVDAAGNVYLCGYTNGSVGGVNVGGNDAFLAVYDSGGTLLALTQLGTGGADFVLAGAVGADGSAFIGGFTEGNLGGINAGDRDAFVVRFSPIPEPGCITFAGGLAVMLTRRQLRSGKPASRSDLDFPAPRAGSSGVIYL